MNRKLLIFLILCMCGTAYAQSDSSTVKKLRSKAEITFVDSLTNEYLDTVTIKKTFKLNDYSMIGLQYGATLSQVMWNPTYEQKMLFLPVNFGFTYTIYGKMFGYMPYFGFQTGLFYGKEGYEFEHNEEKDYTFTIEGAEKVVMEVLELPVLSHIHFDMWHMKIIAQIGFFLGYRMSIERFPGLTGAVAEEKVHAFMPQDNRFDYGIKGGLGFGLVFDPIEIHFQAMYKHSLSTLFKPDHYSQYYYRFGYPSNITISAGIHFQLTKRTGLTKKEIKKQAKNIVYEIEDSDSQSR